jgi:hypothetical protein
MRNARCSIAMPVLNGLAQQVATAWRTWRSRPSRRWKRPASGAEALVREREQLNGRSASSMRWRFPQ